MECKSTGAAAMSTRYSTRITRLVEDKGRKASLIILYWQQRWIQGPNLCEEDKNKIWDAIRCRMRAVHEASLPAPPENAESASNTSIVDDEEVISRRAPMVELLVGIGGESDDEYGQAENPRRDVVDTIIDNDLQYHRSMKVLDILLEGKTEAGEENFSNPLLWWKIHRGVLPLLSTLARRMLCIPATSAPSERVFSTAGLTIAKCRASIQPQHASELIFLHDSWPFAEESEKHRRQKCK